MPEPTPGQDPGANDGGKGGEGGKGGDQPKGLTADDLQKGLDGIAGKFGGQLTKALKPIEDRIAALESGTQKPGDGGGEGGKGDQDGGDSAPDPNDPKVKRAVDAATSPLLERIKKLEGSTKERDRKVTEATISKLASAKGAHDGDLVARELIGRTQVGEDGTVTVLDESGKDPAFDDNGKPVTIETLVTGYLAKHQYLVKSDARSGLGVDQGAGSGDGGGKAATTRKELQQQIADLEKDGKFHEAAPLKVKLMRLPASAE